MHSCTCIENNREEFLILKAMVVMLYKSSYLPCYTAWLMDLIQFKHIITFYCVLCLFCKYLLSGRVCDAIKQKQQHSIEQVFLLRLVIYYHMFSPLYIYKTANTSQHAVNDSFYNMPQSPIRTPCFDKKCTSDTTE